MFFYQFLFLFSSAQHIDTIIEQVLTKCCFVVQVFGLVCAIGGVFLIFLPAFACNSPPYLTNLTSSKSSITQWICRYSSQNVCYVSESASQSMFTGNVLLPVSRDAAGSGLYSTCTQRKGRGVSLIKNFYSKNSWDIWRKAATCRKCCKDFHQQIKKMSTYYKY